MDRRSSASVDNIYFRQHNGEVSPTGHPAEVTLGIRPRLPSDHQNHLALPPLRRSCRMSSSRRLSGGSEASHSDRMSQMGDNVSTFSGGSLAYYYRVCEDSGKTLGQRFLEKCFGNDLQKIRIGLHHNGIQFRCLFHWVLDVMFWLDEALQVYFKPHLSHIWIVKRGNERDQTFLSRFVALGTNINDVKR